MAEISCIICRRLFDPEKSVAMPFCSDRCRLIDLQGWLDERYSLPTEGGLMREDLDDRDEQEHGPSAN